MVNMRERLRHILAQRQRHCITDDSQISAAVLVPLFFKQGQYHLLLTKRTDKVKDHKGQISFPGGVFEEGDETLLDTALRECSEEIGLTPEDVQILGALDDEVIVATNYRVSPFVGFIPWPYRFQPNEDETAKIIEIPIEAFLKHDEFKSPDDETASSYVYRYQDDIIWGATARILSNFLDIFVRAMSDR